MRRDVANVVVLFVGLLAGGCGKSSRALCEQAYDEQYNAAQQSLRENAQRYPTVRHMESALAYGERAGFVGRCSALEPAVARCASQNYVRQHLSECMPHAAAIMALNAPTPLRITHDAP